MRTLKELMNLEGRVALVTGGAGHIGFAIAEALHELGALTVLHDLKKEDCAAAVGRLEVRADWITADLLDEGQTRGIVRTILERHDRLDILVHCAAFVGTTAFPGWAEPMERQSVQAWEAALRVNLTDAFVLVQEAAPALRASGRGSVIFVSSMYGMVGPDMRLYAGTPMQHPAAYGASKAGLLQLTRYFASVLAPQVRVNALTPGGVWRDQPNAFHERYKERTPMARMAVEEDFKGAAAYLASDLSAYVTGQNLVVDGGWTAW
ncbi:MAG TPA: short-chain dehydrogenase [Syntrophus sp. (in: bacteria)]|jgi:NAD(P)-dependent dehydrogenase (short-subunit alcohol dehydrogenase family)|nr:short-chain dehydrogenase [Syntrophus sp. (in: bacteria)]